MVVTNDTSRIHNQNPTRYWKGRSGMESEAFGVFPLTCAGTENIGGDMEGREGIGEGGRGDKGFLGDLRVGEPTKYQG